MRTISKHFLVIVVCGFSFLGAAGQCPARPAAGTVVQDALSLSSQNGVLDAKFAMGYSIDTYGYSHYCYKYDTSTGVVESPTLRLNPGDQLVLAVKDVITAAGHDSVSGMDMSAAPGTIC